MRLLNVQTFEIENGYPDRVMRDATARIWHPTPSKAAEVPEFAILSHRWIGEDASLQRFKTIPKAHLSNFDQLNHTSLDLERESQYGKSEPTGDEDDSRKIEVHKSVIYKIAGACAQARNTPGKLTKSLKYIWIDSICIEKSDSAETSSAINSMFCWYQNAKVCFVYLYDVVSKTTTGDSPTVQEQFISSEWWKRGWTLQELLASEDVRFFDRDWEYIGSKTDLATAITTASGISPEHLTGDFRSASIAQKMSWLSHRNTSRIEDRAYCVLGIFDVYLDTRYGQGEVEFIRLQRAIIGRWFAKTPFDESLFAWKSPYVELSGLLAPAPSCFTGAGDIVFDPKLAKWRGLYRGKGICFDHNEDHQMNLTVPWSAPVPELLVTCFGFISSWLCCLLGLCKLEQRHHDIKLNCWARGQDGRLHAKVIRLRRMANDKWQRINCDTVFESSSLQLYGSEELNRVEHLRLKIPSDVTYRSPA